ncbi:transcriptional regulator [uncultured Clostridium sp.]|uniref:transcriptional regulator n=2 Tax=uncultured Clostridium sp. TaxID=59620 RepID=UPI002729E76B|nr:transcriptional regulator [uncultured Clostridium sp.]
MEILSTGEKIKRSRIYKGITLKELCGDKISISKMSCIENGKIKADDESLRYIAEKLKVDYSYLVRDVYDQIKYNIEDIKKSAYSVEKLKKILNYNLEYSSKYGFNDLSLILTHFLFEIYINNNSIENIQLLISKYYELYQSSKSDDEIIIYYNDMGTFFMKTGEYHEAISYFFRTREIYENSYIEDKKSYVYACFYEGICYKNIKEIEKAYKSLKKVLEFVDMFDDKSRGDFYHEFAILNILLYKVEAERYLNKAFEYKKDDLKELAKFRGKNGNIYFEVKQFEKAMREINDAIEIYPREDKKGCAEFLVECITSLYNNGKYEEAFKYADEALDLAIDIDEIKLIEKGYYFKGMIYQKKGEFIQAEMYMNLATDFLFRFASSEERYKRYNEMAELYYNLGELKESIKYFTLAINIEKKL